MRSCFRSCVVLVGLAGCGSPSEATAPSSAASRADKLSSELSPAPVSATKPPAETATPSSARPDEASVFGRLKTDLVGCYEKGRKSVPTMTDGRLTLNASIDAAGKTTCVIPTDATGLTQEVADCMSARFATEQFGTGAAATVAVRVAVRGGSVELGTRPPNDYSLESVETRRMPDAFEVLETLVPELQACVREIDKASGIRSVLVGARIAIDGRTQCALASGSPTALPAKAAECTEKLFRQAAFPPPNGGPGLILVPIAIMRR